MPPNVSVSTTTMLHKPSVNVPSVQLPDEIVQVTSLDPAFVARILPVPVIDPAYEIVGVLSFVMLSEFDSPESDVQKSTRIETLRARVLAGFVVTVS